MGPMNIVLKDLPVDGEARTQATSALGGLIVQPTRAAETLPGNSTAQGPPPEAMSADNASLNEPTSQPPASSKQDVRDCGHSDSDSDSTVAPVPKNIPVTQDQTDQMSTDSKTSVLSHDSAKKGSASMVPAGPRTLICTRATQLDLENSAPMFPWPQGTSARKGFEKRFQERHPSNCAQQENILPVRQKLAVILDCFGQFLTNANSKYSVRIDRFFNGSWLWKSSQHTGDPNQ